MRDLQAEQIRQAIRTLPPDQHQVIILQYYYDLKLEDIADLLKVNVGTVKSRLFRAREKLSRILEPIDASDGLSCKGGAWGHVGKQ
jgi:RNA polymerase sigma factor (sigma-70 family)